MDPANPVWEIQETKLGKLVIEQVEEGGTFEQGLDKMETSSPGITGLGKDGELQLSEYQNLQKTLRCVSQLLRLLGM